MGRAPSLDLQEAALERTLEDLARAEALARADETTELDEGGCLSARADTVDEPGDETSSPHVIEIEATGSLQFTDAQGEKLTHITVAPGETVVFRLHDTAGFDHNFYIGTEQELAAPIGVTDIGIATWIEGVRELEWTVPSDVSELSYGCTVPGHFSVMRGTFSVSPPNSDSASD